VHDAVRHDGLDEGSVERTPVDLAVEQGCADRGVRLGALKEAVKALGEVGDVGDGEKGLKVWIQGSQSD